MRNAKAPSIVEVQIAHTVKNRHPRCRKMTGYVIPGQDMVNLFSIELARGRNETPPYTPFVAGAYRDRPWPPSAPDFARPRERCGKLQATRKRQTGQTSSFRICIWECIRFIYSCDMAGSWDCVGCLAGQLKHLWAALAIALADNVATAMVYGNTVRPTIEANSRRLIPTEQTDRMVDILTAERGRSKKMAFARLGHPRPPQPTLRGG